ncbi:MAG: hypothetical protein OQK76_09190 [Gammaproteobacteria bacterium]|nr:hypothetical protein [Gammaproteobacteria bacterium]MCW8910777.1 hypothetical protein [Gammaproteobacteria bacterium]MCW9004903.1 hypothetical protein [Gammaproteobacteria bacterium]MCW9054974.1 hypothetical protein [Gammaproteobacteria bacterium]
MKRSLFYLLMLVMIFISGQLQAALSWTTHAPESSEVKKTDGHNHNARNKGKSFFLHDSIGAEVEIWLPTLEQQPLVISKTGVVKVKATGFDNYHLLYARRQLDGLDEMALRYQYMRGKPSGESPGLLVGHSKGTLEIKPSPLTREHRRYQSGDTAKFTLSFNNELLKLQPVIISTSNGTEINLHTDNKGQLTVPIPEDFSNIKSGRRNNRPAEFTLISSITQNETKYQTTLNADYHVNPSHWQSRLGGGLTILFGFIGGLMVLRYVRRRETEYA